MIAMLCHEVSILAWSCGGRLLYAPCANVAHEYKMRRGIPYSRGEFRTNTTKCWTSARGARGGDVDCGGGQRRRKCYDCPGAAAGCAGECVWRADAGVCHDADATACQDGDADWANTKRVFSIWIPELLDSYLYQSAPWCRRIFTDERSLQRRIQLRATMQCKPFEWFRQNVLEIPLPHDPAYAAYLDSLRRVNHKVQGLCSDDDPQNTCKNHRSRKLT